MTVKRIALFWTVAVLAAGMAFAAGGKQGGSVASSSEYKIGVSIPSAEYTFFAAMDEAIKTAYPTDRADVTVFDAQNNQQKQNQDIEDMITQKYNGIVLIPITVEGAVPAIQYANLQNVPVITVDRLVTPDTGAKVIGSVSGNHRDMGIQTATMLIAAMEKMFPDIPTYNVVELMGTQGSAPAILREEGIRSVFTKNPKIKYISLDANFETTKALSVAEDQLTANPNIHGFVCHSDMIAEGAYQALVNMNKVGKVSITGIDGQHSTVELVARGGISGTIMHYPKMVTMGVELICDYLDGKQINETNYFPTELCDSPAVAQKMLDDGRAY
jgi:ABC-type sugar transport system substrate-binding protein